MSGKLARYSNPTIVNHLAVNYVLGTLTPKVCLRFEKLRYDFRFNELNERTWFWENSMAPLSDSAPPLSPKPATWQNIQSKLKLEHLADVEHGVVPSIEKSGFWSWLSPKFYQWGGGLFVLLIVVAGNFYL